MAACGSAATGANEPQGETEGSALEISGQIIWADYGGPTNEARQIAYFESFYEETGVEVVSTTLQDSLLLSMLDGGEGDYSALQSTAALSEARNEHMLEIPEAARGDLLEESSRPYVLGGFVFGIAQGWLTDTFPDGGPQNWVDFFDTEKFPGKRAWPGAAQSFDASFEIALLADGVPADELYPLDIDRAQKKLDTIRDDLVFYNTYPEVQQLLLSETASIAVTVTGQFTGLMNAGEDVTVQWNEAFVVPTGFAVPENGTNPEAVFALGEWMADPERQAKFVEETLYGPVNSEVFDHLSDEVSAKIVNSPEYADIVLGWDNKWRGENYDLLIDEYSSWLSE